MKKDIYKFFESREKSLKFIALIRWPQKFMWYGYAHAYCPTGHLVENSEFSSIHKRYYCNAQNCGILFSPVYGTLFEQSRVPLWKWFLFIRIYYREKNIPSGRQIAKEIEVSNKTAVSMKEEFKISIIEEKEFIAKIYHGIWEAINE